MLVSAPEALFKYLPPSRIDVIQNLLIRFTQASSLNDTLELRPPTKGVAKREVLEEIARNGLTPALWTKTNEQSKKILDQRCPGLSELVGEIYLQAAVQKCTEAIEQRHERNPSAVFDVTDHNFGILSLTEIPYDVPMWAHYADGGRGYLIEFNPGHSWFHGKRDERDSFRHLRQVVYVSLRPQKYLLDTTEMDFLYTKWSVWEAEKEWRIIRCFNDAVKKCENLDSYGNEILLFAIPPDSIRSVVLGISAGDEFEAKLRTVLSNNPELRHVSLKRAVQAIDTGNISIVSGDSCLETTNAGRP